MEKTKLRHLFEQMTFQEKIGQLVQVSPHFLDENPEEGTLTGPLQNVIMAEEDRFVVGSTLNTQTREQAAAIQKRFLEKSRLKIPLLLMADVIHGYRTIFPIPLALGASWNPALIEEMAALSAKEASSEGIQVTFSPMVDLVRDPRWGRVLESTGEDPYLNQVYAEAFVTGYQGTDLEKDHEKIAACVKHFVGYGWAEAGRDYNRVDMSEVELHQNHLPAFQAAIEAGAKLVMTSFNVFNGTPVTANKPLLETVLREQLGFDGVIISDWNAVGELINHGVAEDHTQAAQLAVAAGIDIDMTSYSYIHAQEELAPLQEAIDASVWRVLNLKNDLGLFENPYRGLTEEPIDTEALRGEARKLASQTLVLLENHDQTLPLKADTAIGLVGPFSQSQDVLGSWSLMGDPSQSVTLEAGMKPYARQLQVAPVAETTAISASEWQAIHNVFATSETLVVALGEASRESGEGASKSDITLHPVQIELLKQAHATGKKVVTVLFNGRPLDLRAVKQYSDAVLEAWFPGTEAGNAVADVLFGAVNPSGKLSMSFPYTTGQIPVYYNQIRTGRPLTEETKGYQYVSRYLDIPNEPLYPFGYGKSYATFELREIEQSTTELDPDGEIHFSGLIKNTSNYDGTETIQLYIHDQVATVSRPVKELKKFQKITVPAQSEAPFTFTLIEADLRYIHPDLSNHADPGLFDVFIGTDSLAEKVGTFKLLEGGKG
ncbi:glycoside hydrolase family 3 N-terminal domain-containing protein [Jeotgalibaca sp. A127]|uniref:glycoside hydrolase family 3 N-terminal domain-containing protein n=1 Tax=Jeotgalibaca sp. A127 TaxID=3457324 RepID=UPI003FD15418